ncbi:MAG TPA: VOC family protein [Chloroflexota bacterium]|jgi:catechol 2,3-dioxygenase-like lactoylglutathione lyase family enzyme
MATMTKTQYNVGGVLLERPFKVRRLGHFGFDNVRLEESLEFYRDLLGLRLSDVIDFARFAPDPAKFAGMGPAHGYLLRYGTDHHAFALFNRRVMQALGRRISRPEVTINQITWQVGSLRQVVDGHHWFEQEGVEIQRSGRDPLGSNWHTYVFDPDDHINELYYGIEQIGWDGFSKPAGQVSRFYQQVPDLPHIAELTEVEEALAKGVDLKTGRREVERLPAKYDVEGVLLPRPFKIVRIGPVKLFVENLDACEAFYRDKLGLAPTEEVTWQGHRCVFLRANTEHHVLGLYPLALRDVLGLSPHTTCMSFGLQLGSYQQLRDALAFLQAAGARTVEVPPELSPGIDYTAHVLDPDGHCLQLYYYMEQVGGDGRPRAPEQRRQVTPGVWPEALEPLPDTYLGEPFLGPLG